MRGFVINPRVSYGAVAITAFSVDVLVPFERHLISSSRRKRLATVGPEQAPEETFQS